MDQYILFIALAFIVFYTFLGEGFSSLNIVKRFFVSLFISFICFLACGMFGPFVYIDYKGCMKPDEFNISSDFEVYELYKTGKYFSRYRYDASFLCVSKKGYPGMCQDDHYGNKYRKIDADKVIFTGRVLKMYSLNAFNSNSYDLEVRINGKSYWINPYEYDDIRLGYKKRDRLNREFTADTCSPLDIRDISILY